MRFICLPWMSLPLPSTAGWKCIAYHVPSHLKPSFLAVWAVSEPYFEVVIFHQTLQISTSKALMALLPTRSTSLFGSFLEGDCPKSLVDTTKKTQKCRWKAPGSEFLAFSSNFGCVTRCSCPACGFEKISIWLPSKAFKDLKKMCWLRSKTLKQQWCRLFSLCWQWQFSAVLWSGVCF